MGANAHALGDLVPLLCHPVQPYFEVGICGAPQDVRLPSDSLDNPVERKRSTESLVRLRCWDAPAPDALADPVVHAIAVLRS